MASESSFNPLSLITAPISGAFGLAGSKAQADASKEAARLQAQGVQEGLDFLKGKQAKQETAAQPYLNLGGMAVGRLPQLAASGPSYGAPMPYQTQPRAQMPMAAQPMGAMAQPAAQPQGGGQVVTLRAPDGTTRQFPSGDPRIQQALGLGASQV